MIKWIRNLSLTTQIFSGLGLGILFGILFGEKMLAVEFIGDIWLNLIKLIIVPVILLIVVTSIGGQSDSKSLGKIGSKTIGYYIMTTIIATFIGIAVAFVFKPGVGFNYTGGSATDVEIPEDLSIKTFFTNMVSDNMFASFTEGNMLQVIVIAVLFGIAIIRMEDKRKQEQVLGWFNYMTEMLFAYIWMVIKLSPIGVFFLMAGTVGEYGADILGPFSKLLGTFYVGILIQIFLVYGMFMWVTAKVNPFSFIKKSTSLWLFTISTTSSIASIPVSLDVAKNKFNIREKIADFVIPLGSQINHDGNAILLPSIVVFTSQAVGMDLSVATVLQIVVLGTLLSMGGGGIPGSGIVKVLIVVEAFGLPIEIGAMAAAFYRLFDMGITTANCLGDLSGAVIIDKFTPKDEDVKAS